MTKRTVSSKDRRRTAKNESVDHSHDKSRIANRNHDDAGFDAAAAFHSLCCDLTNVEAAAVAASTALEALPYSVSRRDRRSIGRLFALVETTATVASAALDRVDRAQSQLDTARTQPRAARMTAPPSRGERL